VDLSVVIACKNEERHLGSMLESLTRQTWAGRWEVVVSDNGSTDGTTRVARAYADRLPHLVVVDASGVAGAPGARNLGVERSAGAKLLFVDADDEVADGYVASMATALDTHVLVCARIGFDRLNPSWVLETWPARWQQDGPLTDLSFLPFAGAGTLGVSRPVFEELGGFRTFGQPPNTFEDADLCWRIQLAGHPAPVLVPDAVLHYRLPGSLTAKYHRSRNYTRGKLALHALYGDHGMPSPPRVSLRNVVGSARYIRKRQDMARTLAILGQLIGQRSTAPDRAPVPKVRAGGTTASARSDGSRPAR
jgi:glycosyltransferase involved in cell wall biosynthesis